MFAKAVYGLQEFLLGRNSLKLYKQLEESQWWPREQLMELQLQRFRALVTVAYNHTPYWRSVMDAQGLRSANIRSLEDLLRFPLLTKKDVREADRRIRWQQGGRRVQLARSSGSTNEPIEFYTCSEREAHISAARMRGHAAVGISKGEREMYFWGSPIEITKQNCLKQLRDWLINDGFTDGFNVSEDLVPQYVRSWRRFRPKCIFSYPSSLNAVVEIAQRLDINLSRLRDHGLQMLITTAEPLAPFRERIETAFGVPAFDSYGLREVGLISHACLHHRMHCVEEQLILETIDPDTLELTNGEGELVVTNVVGHVMPLIRYRTGDVVTIREDLCDCGRTLKTIEVTGGRACDFIVTSKGVWLSGYAFAPYLPKEIPGITKLQAQQERVGHVRLLLVTDEHFGDAEMRQVRNAVRKRMQCDDELEIRIVPQIPPCSSGKHRIVVSQVAQARRDSVQSTVAACGR